MILLKKNLRRENALFRFSQKCSKRAAKDRLGISKLKPDSTLKNPILTSRKLLMSLRKTKLLRNTSRKETAPSESSTKREDSSKALLTQLVAQTALSFN